MKEFKIPQQLNSGFIQSIHNRRNQIDPLKKDWSPTRLIYSSIEIRLARHFGFCFGVKNAVEKIYQIAEENTGKTIYLISEMIHNPDVNKDLAKAGVQFIQTEEGEQLIPWSDIHPNSIVVTPAFGTTLEIQELLAEKNIAFKTYDTTCPFVERVWKKGVKLQTEDHTIILHAKLNHEETRATFSRLAKNTVIVQSIKEAQELCDALINGEKWSKIEERTATSFDHNTAFKKVGVINQTTMLAEETQAIADLFENTIQKLNAQHQNTQFTSTRDTLCYATNDNQKAAQALIESVNDIAIVIGGVNSSNTGHLAQLFREQNPTFYIRNQSDLINQQVIQHFMNKECLTTTDYFPKKERAVIAISAGASCPDRVIEDVIQKILQFHSNNDEIHSAEIVF